jgi:hypothetical protein
MILKPKMKMDGEKEIARLSINSTHSFTEIWYEGSVLFEDKEHSFWIVDPRGKDPDGREKLKDVVFDYYKDKNYAKEGLTRESLILNDELPRSEDQQKNKYNVIVLQSGDSDIGAQRKDVKNSFMLEH